MPKHGLFLEHLLDTFDTDRPEVQPFWHGQRDPNQFSYSADHGCSSNERRERYVVHFSKNSDERCQAWFAVEAGDGRHVGPETGFYQNYAAMWVHLLGLTAEERAANAVPEQTRTMFTDAVNAANASRSERLVAVRRWAERYVTPDPGCPFKMEIPSSSQVRGLTLLYAQSDSDRPGRFLRHLAQELLYMDGVSTFAEFPWPRNPQRPSLETLVAVVVTWIGFSHIPSPTGYVRSGIYPAFRETLANATDTTNPPAVIQALRGSDRAASVVRSSFFKTLFTSVQDRWAEQFDVRRCVFCDAV